jgi:hypothetical protein
VTIIQNREAHYREHNPDEIEIGNRISLNTPSSSLTPTSETNSTVKSPFDFALDIELEMWDTIIKEMHKLVQNQMRISKDIFNETVERRKIFCIVAS